jgi:hypothetical protein
MRFPSTHPSLASLSAFAAHELAEARRHRVANHLATCARCQDALRFVHRVNAPAVHSAPPASAALLVRIEASRRAGTRTILPAESPAVHRASPKIRGWSIAAAALVAVAIARVFMPTEAIAASDDGALTLTPAVPRPGSSVRVRYVPASNLFVGVPSLRLRARLRTPYDESYVVPASQVRAVTHLARAKDGAFEGTFRVPDSVVFAVLAVESVDSAKVDDNAGQGWELLVAAPDNRPLFASLFQRSEDMLGRSWEEGYAAAQRATELYPDSVRGWRQRQFFEGQLLTGASGDSAAATTESAISALVAKAKAAPTLSVLDMDGIYYRSYSMATRPGATARDSAEWNYWWTRMLRDFPKHEQAAQRYAVWMNVKALGNTRALDSLEKLYAFFAPLRTPAGKNLPSTGVYVASQLGDVSKHRLWTSRSLIGAADSARQLAVFLASVPQFRDEGLTALRTLLRDPTVAHMVTRPLGRNAAAHARAVSDLRRSMFSALGRGLVASGKAREALDTLRLAANGGWEPALFSGLARSYLMAGDTLSAMTMRARQVVDGRTTNAVRDSLQRMGEQRLGATRWVPLVDEARREMHARVLERSIARAVAPTASARSRDGRDHPLRALTGGHASLVIFWSRHCGYALEALPEISTLIARLRTAGTPVVFVVDEPASADFDEFLKQKQITWPVHYDARTALGNAMRNFGTPHYYVVDGANRIRFSGVEEIGDLYGRLAAVAADDASR